MSDVYSMNSGRPELGKSIVPEIIFSAGVLCNAMLPDGVVINPRRACRRDFEVVYEESL
jgi:hypothetical protein